MRGSPWVMRGILNWCGRIQWHKFRYLGASSVESDYRRKVESSMNAQAARYTPPACLQVRLTPAVPLQRVLLKMRSCQYLYRPHAYPHLRSRFLSGVVIWVRTIACTSPPTGDHARRCQSGASGGQRFEEAKADGTSRGVSRASGRRRPD